MRPKKMRKFKPPMQVEFIKSEAETLAVLNRAARICGAYNRALKKTERFTFLKIFWPERVHEFREYLLLAMGKNIKFRGMLMHVVHEIRHIEAMEAHHPFAVRSASEQRPEA